jgi:hypothetical protein
VQNAKVKKEGKNNMACDHTLILQFEIYNLHFALAAAEGRTTISRCENRSPTRHQLKLFQKAQRMLPVRSA